MEIRREKVVRGSESDARQIMEPVIHMLNDRVEDEKKGFRVPATDGCIGKAETGPCNVHKVVHLKKSISSVVKSRSNFTLNHSRTPDRSHIDEASNLLFSVQSSKVLYALPERHNPSFRWPRVSLQSILESCYHIMFMKPSSILSFRCSRSELFIGIWSPNSLRTSLIQLPHLF